MNEIIKSWYFTQGMADCRICGRISATGEDHLDCVQRRDIEAAGPDAREIREKLSIEECDEMGKEVRAVLDYMAGDPGASAPGRSGGRVSRSR